ncbi:hypothetical protein HaLaN_25257 [Haematococcus lacustris]|uniref:Uncharacterized protein n=1 Tax=Haematococcus lacustris TaxID=44745 RepID=A0A6A0A3E4_HAELA|nr:hypothetical protein HaLaN_25257 [Haematococcus lacustris]
MSSQCESRAWHCSARNRICSARAAKVTQPNTLLVSIEGGVGRRPVDGKMECFAWAVAEHGSTGSACPACSVPWQVAHEHDSVAGQAAPE